MPRSDAERLTLLLTTRDSIEDALAASASNADVIRYQTGDGREVERSRLDALKEVDQLDKQIANLQLRVHGAARNHVNLNRTR